MKKRFCEYCGLSLDDNCGCYQAIEERNSEFMANYENDPLIQDGWVQQDTIDMYRREK